MAWFGGCTAITVMIVSCAVTIMKVNPLKSKSTHVVIPVLDIFTAVTECFHALYILILVIGNVLEQQKETLTVWSAGVLCRTAAHCLLLGIFTPMLLCTSRHTLLFFQLTVNSRL